VVLLVAPVVLFLLLVARVLLVALVLPVNPLALLVAPVVLLLVQLVRLMALVNQLVLLLASAQMLVTALVSLEQRRDQVVAKRMVSLQAAAQLDHTLPQWVQRLYHQTMAEVLRWEVDFVTQARTVCGLDRCQELLHH